MKREELVEFHHLTAIRHVPSILELGILSHERAVRRRQIDISNQGVQGRRRTVRVPGGRRLHEYACLYVHARNAMLYSMRERRDLAVVAVDVAVLDLPGTVVTDRNAGAYAALFQEPAAGVAALDAAIVRARFWSDETKQRRQAEVLVPDVVAPPHLRGAYVPTELAYDALRRLLGETPFDLRVNPDLFLLEAES